LRLVHLGTGAFRSVYRIKGTDYVIKFPEPNNNYLGIDHAQDEVKNIEKMKKIKCLRPHLPKIHHYDRKSGVIVMDYYTRYRDKQANKPHPTRTYGDISWERELISDLIRILTGVWFNDLWDENLKLDKNNIVKFVDVGC
jgi:hypothetical protein